MEIAITDCICTYYIVLVLVFLPVLVTVGKLVELILFKVVVYHSCHPLLAPTQISYTSFTLKIGTKLIGP